MNKILQGDSLEVVKTLPDESVDCVVTSPPYWALRDYGVDSQLGLEPTFKEYINKLCDVFDEVKRVLKKDGTCWVVIGDTYAGSGKGATSSPNPLTKECYIPSKKYGEDCEYQSKCLLQIPSRFAIEMTDRGWILRNELIWHKPNCMPSSAKDRFTVDFEKIFFFTKNKKYYFKQIHEEILYDSVLRSRRGHNIKGKPYATQGLDREYKGYEGVDEEYNSHPGRNKRTTWTINTEPNPDAHFAVFPKKIPATCIEAGCPEGGVVLDPFCGSGTTCHVAKDMGRKYIGIDLNPEYVKMAENNLRQEVLSFTG